MSYHPTHTTPPPHRGVSKWWPIGLGLGALVCYAVGGGCAGSACAVDYYGDVYCDISLWAVGVTFCSLGGCLTIAWLVTLILWLSQRSKARRWNGGQHVPMLQQQQQQPVAAQAYAKESPAVEVQSVGDGGRQFCGKCGAGTSTAFCQSCGAKA